MGQGSRKVIMTQNKHLREAQTAAQVPGPEVTAFPRYGQFWPKNGHFWPKMATFGLKRPFLVPEATHSPSHLPSHLPPPTHPHSPTHTHPPTAHLPSHTPEAGPCPCLTHSNPAVNMVPGPSPCELWTRLFFYKIDKT